MKINNLRPSPLGWSEIIYLEVSGLSHIFAEYKKSGSYGAGKLNHSECQGMIHGNYKDSAV